MNSETIFKKLNTLEESLDLRHFKVNDIDVWPMIRFQFVLKLNSEILGEDSVSQNYASRVIRKAKLIPSAVRGLLNHTIRDIKRPRPTPGDLLFLTDSSAKRMKLAGKWFDAFVDPILDHYESQNVSYNILETSQRFLFRTPGVRPSRSLVWTMIWGYIQSILKAHKISFSEDFLKSYSIYEELLHDLEVESAQVHLTELRMEVSYLSQLLPVFQKYVDEFNPKLVFLIP